MHLVLDTSGLALKVRNKSFLVVSKNEKKKIIDPSRLESVSVTAGCNIHTSAMALATEHQLPMIIYNRVGGLVAIVSGVNEKILSINKRKQVDFNGTIAQQKLWIGICLQKVDGQMMHLRHLQKQGSRDQKGIGFALQKIEKKYFKFKEKEINGANWRSVSMGIEGMISKNYWEGIRSAFPQEFTGKGRSKRPAHDVYNAMLNYVYGFLYKTVHLCVLRAGLDPMLGFAHADGRGRKTLVFDLIEAWRPAADWFLSDFIMKDGKKQYGHIGSSGWVLSKSAKRSLIRTYHHWLEARGRWLGVSGKRISLIQDYITDMARIIKSSDKE